MHNRPIKECSLNTLSFSACGNFVLARNAKDTEVLLIPPDMLSPLILGHEMRPKRKTSPEYTEPNEFSTCISRLGGGQYLPGQTLSGSNLLSTGGIPRIMNLTSVGKNIDLEMFPRNSACSNTRIRLLALPNSLDTKNTAVSIKIPAEPDEYLRIMLNKDAAEDHTLDTNRDFAHPTMVEKNVKSIVGGLYAMSTAPSSSYPSSSTKRMLTRQAHSAHLLKSSKGLGLYHP